MTLLNFVQESEHTVWTPKRKLPWQLRELQEKLKVYGDPCPECSDEEGNRYHFWSTDPHGGSRDERMERVNRNYAHNQRGACEREEAPRRTHAG